MLNNQSAMEKQLTLRYRWRYRLTLILLTLLLSNTSLHAAISHTALYDWYTIESAHFRVHYHTGEEPLAQLTANIAERVHNKLSNWIQWLPADKTDLVVSDEFDGTNGSATPFPSNRSRLYVSLPDSITGLEDHAGWLETLITHEYLHTLHLDKATHGASMWRTLLGRNPFFLFNTFPATSLPGWAVEGLSTYAETDVVRGIGRGQSSYYAMLMRLEVFNGVKPIHQVNQQISSWPLGATSYLYGVNYYQFIEQRYGAKTINDLVDDYASNFLPYRINRNTEYVLNKNLVELWDEYQGYLQQKHQPKIAAIQQAGINAGTQLTFDGYFDNALTVLPNGPLYYVSYDALQNAALMKRDNTNSTKIVRVEFGTRLDVHATAGLLLAQPSLCDNSQIYYDLYKMDLDSNELNRLTSCARYRMANWSPDGSQIIAVHNQLGKNTLVLLDANAKKTATLWQGEIGNVISHFDWAPDGLSIIAAVYRKKSGWNLEQFNLTDRTWSFLTKNNEIQNFPKFSLDGKSLYYSAEYQGVYNVFNLSLETKAIVKLSNVLGAAFNPVPYNKQGDIFYIGHHSNGMDLYQLPKAQQLAEKVILDPAKKTLSTGIEQSPAPVVDTTKPEAYSPWSSLRPRWWYPVFIFDDDISLVGFNTSSSDLLARHNYISSIGYDSKNKVTVGVVDYIYDRYWPVFKLHYDRSLNILYGSDNKFARTKVTDVAQIETLLPFLGLKERYSLHFAYGYEMINDARRAVGVPLAKQFNDAYYGAALVYNNSTRKPRAISRNQGRHVSLTIEDSIDKGDNFYRGVVKSFDWREFLPLGGKHVLAVRVVSGRGDTGSKPFRLGGSSISSSVPPLLNSTLISSPFNRRAYNLRGYSTGFQTLRGNNINLLSAEYRFPLIKLERGFMTPPVGLHELHAAIFYDSGAAWNNSVASPQKYYAGTGIEITAESNFFFKSRLSIVLGYASGLDKTLGENKVYLRLNASY